MPVSSMQISGLIGGQQAMFANNMAYSQQLSGAFGTGPAGGMQPMQNPYPGASYGYPGGWENAGNFGNAATQAVGMGASMAPIGMGAVSLGGMMAGGRMGWLDPFTGTARAFSAGSGGLGNIGSHVAAGRFGSAAARIGLGTAAGLATGGLYMAGAAAVTGAASSVYEGAQLVNDVSSMSRRFGPSFGTPGARPGGQMARGQIQGVVDVLHELASESVIASVTDVTKLLDRFSRMGQLTGITNAVDFKRRFSDLVKQVDSVAKVLGTSLEEAAPLVTSMRSMGMWRPSDIMGTAYAMRQVGPQAAPALMASMQTGAQQSWAQGGTLGAGAATGRQAFLNVQAAGRLGVMNDQFITEMTGGTGGVEGQAMVAGQITGTMSRFTQHPMGQLMMAGLGEMKDGEFTGRMDEALMAKFKSGQISTDELQRMGMGRVQKGGKGGRAAATSFMMRRSMMGQEMAATGGPEAMGMAVQQIIKKGHFEDDSEAVQARVLQNVLNVDEKTAYMWARYSANMPAINENNARAARDNINDQFRELDRKLNHSFEGFKIAMTKRSESFWRPFKEFGGRLTTEIASSVENWFQSTVMGYQRPIAMGELEKGNILAGMGVGGGAAYMSKVQASGFNPATMGVRDLDSTLMQKIRGDSGLGELVGAAGMGRAASGNMAVGEMKAGDRFVTGVDVERFVRGAVSRSRDRTAEGAGLKLDDPETAQSLGILKSELRMMMLDPAQSNRLRTLKKQSGNNPVEYQRQVLELMTSGSGRGSQAMQKLLKGKVGTMDEKFNILAVASEMAGGGPSDMNLDWDKAGEVTLNAYGLSNNPKELERLANESADTAAELIQKAQARSYESTTGKKFGGLGWGGLVGGIVGGVGGMLIGGPMGAVIGFTGGATAGKAIFSGANALGAAVRGGLGKEEIRTMMLDSELGPELEKWLKAGMPQNDESNKFVKAAMNGDRAASGVLAAISSMSKEERDQLAEAARSGNLKKGAIALEERRTTTQELGKTELASIDSMRTQLKAETFREYRKILELDASGSLSQQDTAERAAVELAKVAGEGDLKALMGTTGRGRQIATMASVNKMKMGYSTKDWEAESKRFGGIIGALTEEQQAKISRYAADKGGMDAREMREIKEMMIERVATGGLMGKGKGPGGQSVEELLTKYTSANTAFVFAVSDFLVKGKASGNNADLQKAMEQMVRDHNPSQTTPAAQR